MPKPDPSLDIKSKHRDFSKKLCRGGQHSLGIGAVRTCQGMKNTSTVLNREQMSEDDGRQC